MGDASRACRLAGVVGTARRASRPLAKRQPAPALLPPAQVAACKEGSVYYVRVVAPDGAMLEELAMNADTRCLSATGVHIASIQAHASVGGRDGGRRRRR